MKNFEYISAKNYESATAYLAGEGRKDTLVKAGGVDVMDRLKERLAQPERVLNLQPIQPLPMIIPTDVTDLTIDAMTTLAALAMNPSVITHFPALATAASEAASPQIRSVATIGGNLCQKPRCWYYRSQDFQCLKKGGSTCFAVHGDNRYHAIIGAGACHIVHPSSIAIPLLAHAASIRIIASKNGKPTEREIPIDNFYRVPPNPQDDEHVLEPGELIRFIDVPLNMAGPRSAFVEIREKQAFDWPLAMCAVNLNDKAQPRVVLGAVAPIPWRAKKIEEMLVNADISEALIEKCGAAAKEGAQPLSHNKYKVDLISVAVMDAIRKANAGKV